GERADGKTPRDGRPPARRPRVPGRRSNHRGGPRVYAAPPVPSTVRDRYDGRGRGVGKAPTGSAERGRDSSRAIKGYRTRVPLVGDRRASAIARMNALEDATANTD